MFFFISETNKERIRLDQSACTFDYHLFIEACIKEVIRLNDEVLAPLPPDQQLIVEHDRDTHEEGTEHAEVETNLDF